MKAGNGIGYKDVERGLRLIADKFGKSDDRRKAPFKDKNFMTPNIVAVRRLDNGLWYELSYGSNFSRDGWIFGVTIADRLNNTFDSIKGVSIKSEEGCCYEFSEVEELLVKVDDIRLGDYKTDIHYFENKQDREARTGRYQSQGHVIYNDG